MSETTSPDLREQIADALRTAAVNLNYAPEGLADAVIAVVQPEIEQLCARLEAAESDAHRIYESAKNLDDLNAQNMANVAREIGECRQRAERAEAERDDYANRLRAVDRSWANLAAERDQLKATVARVQAVHHLKEWVSLSDVCGRHHWFRQVGPTAENIAVADVCPDCRPRRYMCCVCADDECPVLVALDQPADSKGS